MNKIILLALILIFSFPTLAEYKTIIDSYTKVVGVGDNAIKVKVERAGSETDYIEKTYRENGILALEAPFKNGKKDGTLKIYYPSGAIAKEVIFVSGEPTEGYNYDDEGKNKQKMSGGQIQTEKELGLI